MTFLTLSFLLYFLPAILASSRRHPSAGAIWVTNLCTGWTLIGWVVCLVWALAAPPLPQIPLGAMPVYAASPAWAVPVQPGGTPAQPVLCGVCLRPIDPTARFCGMCGSSHRTSAAG